MGERSQRDVTLVLGGGGAKGFVHLGVIDELVTRGFEIKAIVGTSIGAIIGALFSHYAHELFQNHQDPQRSAIDQLIDVMLALQFWKHADINYVSAFRKGVIGGASIDSWLAERLVYQANVRPIRFGELDFDLTITATDAHTGDTLVLNKSTEPGLFIHAAVRASMSMQWIFKEIQLEVGGRARKCWDGGTTGNCRFDIAARLYPGRRIIASSLTYRGDVVETNVSPITAPFRPIAVLNHTTSILMRSFEESLHKAMPEDEVRLISLIQPSLSIGSRIVSTYDFGLKSSDRETLIQNGRNAVRRALDTE